MFVDAPLLSALSVGPARVPRRCVAAAGWPGAGRRRGCAHACTQVLAMLAMLAMLAIRFAVGRSRWPCPFDLFCWLCWLFVFDSQHSQQIAWPHSYQFDIVGIVGYFGTRFKSLAAWDYMQLLYIYNTIFNFFVSNFA